MQQLELGIEDAAPSTKPAPSVKPKQRRGFAVMDPERVRAIARSGGRAAHAQGTAHKFTSEEARVAGKKGGNAHHRVRGRGKR